MSDVTKHADHNQQDHGNRGSDGKKKEKLLHRMVDGVKVYPRGTTPQSRRGSKKGLLDRDKTDEDWERLRRSVGYKISKHTPGGVEHDQELHGDWSDGSAPDTESSGGGATLTPSDGASQPNITGIPSQGLPTAGEPSSQTAATPDIPEAAAQRPGGRVARPNTLDGLVGQEKVRERLQLMVDAARMRGTRLDHIMFSGPPGLGKTTLAKAIANEMGGKLKVVTGNKLRSSDDIVALLSNLEDGDIVFIDEIHQVPTSVDEILFPIFEDGEMDISIKGIEGSVRVKTPDVTFIGATTNPEGVAKPLRDRFGAVEQLSYYSTDEIMELTQKTGTKLGLEMNDEAAREIASRSRGVPRMANRLMRRYDEYMLVKGLTPSKASADQMLNAWEIDSRGLTKDDRKVMSAIGSNTVGLNTLAATTGFDTATVASVIEPFLLREGLITRTGQGRKLTQAGHAHMESYDEPDQVSKSSSSNPFNAPVTVAKSDTRKNMVFGWANVTFNDDGTQLVDHQGHMIDVDDLEDAAYGFAVNYRKSGDMHSGESFGELVESLIVTQDKVDAGGFPQEMIGKWWVGFKVPPERWDSVRSGSRSMFSIQGKARLEPV